MSSDFDRVKDALNLRDVITGQTGFKVNNAGHLSECPFCQGTDCFSIPKGGKYLGTWKCHRCSKSGDVFTFLELHQGLDAKGALEKAAQIAGIPLEEKKGKGLRLTTADKIRLEAADYYHAHMLVNGGHAYLIEKRGHKEDVLKRMKVGYSDGRLVDHLRGKGFSDEDLIKSGMVTRKKVGDQERVLDFFAKGLAIFPHSYRGRVIHFTMKDPEKKLAYQLPGEYRHKDWRFYHQEAIDKYQELILVEGENDLLSVLDAGVHHVFGLIGQISDEQLKALESRCRGKNLYLWMDNDSDPEKPLTKGKGYVRRICQRLAEQNVRIVVYPEDIKDPDDYLRDFAGDKRTEIMRLQREALDYVAWEIREAGFLPDLEAKLTHLKQHGVFERIALQPEIHQQIYGEKLQEIGFSEKAVAQQLEGSQELRQEIESYFLQVEKPQDVDPNLLGQLIYRWFARHGRFYFDGGDTVYLIHKNKTYEVGDNVPFNAMLHKMTGLNYKRAPAPAVWEALRCIAYNNGRRIDRAQWIYHERVKEQIFLNLNSPNNKILRIGREGIREVPNGMNEDHVLLSQSPKISPFNYLPDADVHEGMTALKELVFDNLVCEPKQRFMVLCWLISGFCPDFAPYQALMKFSGSSGGGKSTAAKLLTSLIYGNEHLSDPTGAAAFSLATQNPLLVIDNLENRDVTRGMQKFLLLLATRGTKEKRTSGTESDTTQESPRALGCITAIEPFTLPELINRTYDLHFDVSKYGSDDFYEDDVLTQLKRKRDLILSAILKFIHSEVMPNLDKRKNYITVLRTEYRGHSKERTNEYMALLMTILDRLLKYISFYDDVAKALSFGTDDDAEAREIRKAWIETQNSLARDNEVTSNNILKLMDGLVREYLQKFKELGDKAHLEHVDGYEEDAFVMRHQEYGLEMVKTKPEVKEEKGERFTVAYIEFTATSSDIVHAFDRFCRNNGMTNPYPSAAVFGSRLGNDLKLLAKGGWEIVTKDGSELYFRIIRGKRFLRFRHTLIR